MNLLSIRETSKQNLEYLIKHAQQLKNLHKQNKALPNLNNKVIGMLFFEDSTRTRVSFEQAARKLNLQTTSFGMLGSSMSKGESLKDTVLTLQHEGLDALVMRHHSSGAPYLAQRFFSGPVINAGDGMHEHPTQALADALTIIEHKNQIENLKVAIVGDVLHSRVARSNLWLLTKLGASVNLVGPKTLLPKHPGLLPAALHYDLISGIENADVVMALRLQKERMDSGLISSIGEYASLYQVNERALRFASPDCLVMHPGPINRGLELDDRTADGKNSVISQQVENGVFVRMAVFDWMFQNGTNKITEKPKPKPRKTK